MKPGFEPERPKLLGTKELLAAPHVTTVVVAPAERPIFDRGSGTLERAKG
jgi:hypothetical protein